MPAIYHEKLELSMKNMGQPHRAKERPKLSNIGLESGFLGARKPRETQRTYL